MGQRIGESAGHLRSVEQADVRGKWVIVRVDWNVTLGKALQIVDDTRIIRTLPTINWLLEHGAKQVILMSHLGKPPFAPVELRSGAGREKYSLKPVVEYASHLMGEPIRLVSQFANFPEFQSDRLVMLENLRLWEGEEQNDAGFAKQLADLGDMYVNEAFGESHREAASIVGISKLLPSYAGLWLQDEVETIMRVRSNPERPYVVVMGGAKVEDKIKLIEILSQSADTILLGKTANEYVQRNERSGKRELCLRLGVICWILGQRHRSIYQRIASKQRRSCGMGHGKG